MESHPVSDYLKKEEEVNQKVTWLNLSNTASNEENLISLRNSEDVHQQFEEKRNESEKVYTALMSQKDMLDFKQIYVRHRSKWAYYTKRFTDKNEAQLKNFFHNSLRRLSSQFIKAERNNKIFQKSNVSSIFLHNIIDISLVSKGITEDDLIITKIGDRILYCLYQKPNPEDQDLLETCKMVRTLHSLIKHMKMVKKFIQNDQTLKTVAQFIIRKERELATRSIKGFSKKSGEQMGQIPNCFGSLELYEANQVVEYGYYPENYMAYWPMVPPISYCFYQQQILQAAQEPKIEIEIKKEADEHGVICKEFNRELID